MNVLGLNQVLDVLQSVGSALYSQLLSLATQALLAGTNMWNQALPVFNNLVAELTSHAGNAVQLVSQAVLQLTSVLASGPSRQGIFEEQKNFPLVSMTVVIYIKLRLKLVASLIPSAAFSV